MWFADVEYGAVRHGSAQLSSQGKGFLCGNCVVREGKIEATKRRRNFVSFFFFPFSLVAGPTSGLKVVLEEGRNGSVR